MPKGNKIKEPENWSSYHWQVKFGGQDKEENSIMVERREMVTWEKEQVSNA